MKRALCLLLAVFYVMTMVACPAPAPEGGGSTTTTTTTAGSGSGGTGSQPTAPLSLSASSPYYLVGDEIALSAGGTEGKSVWFVAPDGSVSGAVENGASYTATAAAVGVHTFTVTDGTRTASCNVTVFSKEDVDFAATDENIRILGRTEKNADGAILLNNTASGFEVTFYGKSLSVLMCNAAGGSDTAKFAVYIDGEGDPATDQINLRTAGVVSGDSRLISICSFETAGLHTVRLQKITQEALSGAVFSGVRVMGGLLPVESDEALRLMVYGDSITCGHSNMRPDGAADKQCSEYENGMLTYAMRAAAALNADAHVFSKSGIGLYTDPYAGTTHLKDVYTKVSPGSKTEWDMESWVPHAVVINIGTNDIWAPNGSAGDPPYTKEGFVEAYLAMVHDLIDIWGGDTTFFLCSSMMASNLGAHVQEVVMQLMIEGFDVYYVALPMASPASKHPDNAAHIEAAAVLYSAIADNVWVD